MERVSEDSGIQNKSRRCLVLSRVIIRSGNPKIPYFGLPQVRSKEWPRGGIGVGGNDGGQISLSLRRRAQSGLDIII